MSEDAEVPAVAEHGVLVEGIHPLTIEQIKQLFGSFQRSDRRCRLFDELERYFAAIRKTGWSASVILDGSFVMPCIDEPEDIDLLVVLPQGWNYEAELAPAEYNLLSRSMARKLFKFDVFVAEAGSEAEKKWIDFFAQVNVKWSRPPFNLPVDANKGLVRIVP